MNITIEELFNKSVEGQKYITKLNKNRQDQGICYPWIGLLNEFLNGLADDQKKIVLSNFKEGLSLEQIFDHLVELLIAIKYRKETPIFFSDNKGMPDIYLSATNKYLEVKRIRNSDNEKIIIEGIMSTGRTAVVQSSSLGISEVGLGLKNKIQSHIDNAFVQLDRQNPLSKKEVILVFSTDLIGHYHHLNEREDILKEFAKGYFILKQNNNEEFTFQILRFNSLFQT